VFKDYPNSPHPERDESNIKGIGSTTWKECINVGFIKDVTSIHCKAE
jgi:hypothetical protein